MQVITQKNISSRATIFSIILLFLILIFHTQQVFSKTEKPLFRQKEFIKTGEKLSKQKFSIKNTGNVIFTTKTESVEYILLKKTQIKTSGDVWEQLARCESHENWQIDTGNGYFGGLQFSLGAWASTGGSGKPSEASKEEQIQRGKILQQDRGWGAWGTCAKILGLL